ncbi:MAG: hypothetical protein JNL73_16715 [Anaerolineales bacterium]|nr:hypothetical protein [Anaerolineales bacterium]
MAKRVRLLLAGLLLLISVFDQSKHVPSAQGQGGPGNELRLPTLYRSYFPAAPRDGCLITRSTAATATYPTTHPRVLLSHTPTKTCLQQLLTNGVASATRFKNYVDGQLAGGNYYAFEAWHAALMYQLTGNTTYATYAINWIDTFVAGEEALINQGQRAEVAGDSYLYVGDLVGDVMLVYDWTYERLTPTQRTRWVTYANQAVWNVWHPSQAQWGGVSYPWSGWSIDNPANNYYYSFLRATMLTGLASRGENAQAQSWIDTFRTTKLETQLFPTFNSDLTGGGSREGTGYGVSLRGLFRLYDWWERSTGERIADKTPHTLATMAFMLHSIVPTLDRLAPTGDHARESTAALFDYHREQLLELMALYPGERLAGVADTALAASSVPEMGNRFMFVADFLYNPPVLIPEPQSRLSTAYWGPGTGQFAMRSDWTSGAAYSNLICGPYTESHAHRDQGSFVIYRGSWLAYDSNIASHSGIEQDEDRHNLVRITQNGSPVTQVYDRSCHMAALADTTHFTYALAQVTPMYTGKSQVSKIEREYLFLKPGTFVVFDRVVTAGSGISRIWTLNTPAAPTISGDRITYVAGGNRLDVYRLAPTGLSATTTLVDGGTRIDVADGAGTQSLFLHVVDTNGAVTTAVRSDSAGQTGVQITFADGRTALVRFSNTGLGGTLDLRAPGGAVLYNSAMPTTVTAPPVFAN